MLEVNSSDGPCAKLNDYYIEIPVDQNLKRVIILFEVSFLLSLFVSLLRKH